MAKNGKRQGRGVVVSMKDLVKVMLPIIENGDRNKPKENLEQAAKELGVAPSTVLGKIRKWRKEHPQFQLIDTTYFTGRQGPYTEVYTEDELNSFFAEVLGKPKEEVEQKVAEIRDVEEETASTAN